MHDDPPTPPLSPDQALDWPGRSATNAAVIEAVNRRVQLRRRARRRTAATVTVLSLAVALGAMWRHADRNTPADSPAVTATIAQPIRQVLAEGSTIEFNGDAEVRVEFTPRLRRVRIVRGEAYFDVAHDSARPFVVVAGDVSVRAVGTAFTVRLASAGVNVLVTDGRVAVDRASIDPVAAPVQPLASVSKGARVDVSAADLAPTATAPVVVTVSATELAERLAWRIPRLEFNDTPLREAIALFNRHSPAQLTLAVPALGDLRVSGIVRADNTAALLQLLRAEYGIDAQRHGERDFVLSSRR